MDFTEPAHVTKGESMVSEVTGGAARRPLWKYLYVQVLVAIALGVMIGCAWPTIGVGLKPLGDGFVKLVRMIIAPVIFLTIVGGIAHLRELGALGRIALKAFAYFLALSTLALILGLIVANVCHPGAGMHVDPATLDPSKIADYATKAHEQTVTGFLLSIIPQTVLSALSDGDILQVLFVAILFGIALARAGEPAAPLLGLIEAAEKVVFRMVSILMRAAPIGAFGAIAFTVGQYGLAVLANLAALVATFYLTSLVFVLLVLGAVGRAAGFSILRLLRYLAPELLLVLGTSSSEAALPGLIQKMEAAGCARSVVGVVVPTGYSFNLDGTNIYMTLASLFIAQACGIHLTIGQQALLLGVAMLSSKGAAGVTGAGFITLAATLSIVPSVPVAGMALILGVDRFMSECRSLTNFVGNAVATIVVARWEGALDRPRLDSVLSARPRAIEAA
jgi:aerobic C4-dicarboxylate transport protein